MLFWLLLPSFFFQPEIEFNKSSFQKEERGEGVCGEKRLLFLAALELGESQKRHEGTLLSYSRVKIRSITQCRKFKEHEQRNINVCTLSPFTCIKSQSIEFEKEVLQIKEGRKEGRKENKLWRKGRANLISEDE